MEGIADGDDLILLGLTISCTSNSILLHAGASPDNIAARYTHALGGATQYLCKVLLLKNKEYYHTKLPAS